MGMSRSAMSEMTVRTLGMADNRFVFLDSTLVSLSGFMGKKDLDKRKKQEEGYNKLRQHIKLLSLVKTIKTNLPELQ